MSYADPARAPKPNPSTIQSEPTGAVASDSLAAESNRAGGGFSENENIAQLSVKGASSTLANTDTSGATALHAASSGAERERQDAKGLGSDERGVTGVKYPDAEAGEGFGGTHTAEGYTGGPSAERTLSGSGGGSGGDVSGFSGATGDSFADGGAGLTGDSSGKDPNITSGSAVPLQSKGASAGASSSTSGGSSGGSGGASGGSSGPDAGTGAAPYVETAPNYAATVSGSIRSEGELKPKGENLVEGDIPETKTFTGNVGGDKDPGRLAEQKFEKINADTAGGLKYDGKGGDNSNPYDALESERA